MPHGLGCCERHSWEGHEGSAAEFATSRATAKYAPDMVLEPTHMDISIDFSQMVKKALMLKVAITIKNPRDRATGSAEVKRKLAQLALNGVSFGNLSVTSRVGPPVNFSYDGKLIGLSWDSEFKPNEERVVCLSYTVDQPIAGFYFSTPSKISPKTPLYAITDHETERCRYWLACVDYPSVRTTLSFHLLTEGNHVALANGGVPKVELLDGGARKLTHYDLSYRCPSYLICVSAGELIEVDDGEVDGMPIKYFGPQDANPEDIRRAFDETPNMVRWLSKRLNVKFPWPKYYQIASPKIRGAMENISLVTWSDMFVLDATWARERKFLTDLVNIHEMAHTYFGDMVVIRHFEHAWLKESWATYIESCWIEDHKSADDFRFEMVENADAYIAETARYFRPIVTRVYDSSWALFDSHTYPGGCWRLHMLRRKLGEEVFWPAVTDYLERHKFQTVETEDFRKALESRSGLNLNPFFDQWVYGKGFPQLKGYWQSENGVYTLTIEQTQADKKRELSSFDLCITVEVLDSTGKSRREVAVLSAAEPELRGVAVFNLEGAKPVSLSLDPEGDYLFTFELDGNEELLLDTAKKARDVATRIWAYKSLCKIGTPSVLKKVSALLVAEPFYGVRVKAANALSKVKTVEAAKTLAVLLENEKDPMAMFSVAKACSLREPCLEKALKKFLERDDLTYRGRAAALESLALQLNPQSVPYILQIAENDAMVGQHALIRSGALRALGNDRSIGSFEYLLSRVQAGLEPDRARNALFSAIADSAQWHSLTEVKRALDVLANEGLRDENLWVRMAAIGGIMSLNGTEYASFVENCKKDMPEIDWPFVDKRLKQLKHGGYAQGPGSSQEKVKELTKSLEDLESKYRKLESKVYELMQKSQGTAPPAVPSPPSQ